LTGPSGCGKSTLLHLLGGLDRPSGGELWLARQSLNRMGERALARMRRDAVGFVFQAFQLMDERTAVENVELPALLAGRSPRAARRPGYWSESGCPTGPGSCPGRCPGASASGSRSPGRWSATRWWSWPTSQPATSTARQPLDVLRLFESLHAAGQTLVVVTHDSRIAATADRMISMRDGAFIDETRLTGGTTGHLGSLVGLEG
jgi:ABC-type lipoprotein export system ATPase subunit